MRFAGVTPEEAPDPREHLRALLEQMPVPHVGFVAQPHLDSPLVGINAGSNRNGLHSMAVTLTYVLLRNPDDPGAPENLAELDDETEYSLEMLPSSPRPPWAVEMAERMRHLQLWEAVKTSWHHDVAPEIAGVDVILRAHVDHVLRNRFSEVIGWTGRFLDPVPPADVTPAAVQHRVPFQLDGVEREGIKIDTDPFVFGIGAQLDRHTAVTAVVPRDVLDLVVLEFATQE